MKKTDAERAVLDLSLPLLKEIYGGFDVDPDQEDRPDAAIILRRHAEGEKEKIGIEITSVDRQEDLQYLNDEKILRPVILGQLRALQEDGGYGKQPNKRTEIFLDESYMLEGLLKKQEKYNGYIRGREYKEVIIVAFSDYVDSGTEHFDILVKWTNYFLSVKKFVFDKVIFVSRGSSRSAVIYDKSRPEVNLPTRKMPSGACVEVVQGPIFPIGREVSISGLFESEPLVPRRKKGKKK